MSMWKYVVRKDGTGSKPDGHGGSQPGGSQPGGSQPGGSQPPKRPQAPDDVTAKKKAYNKLYDKNKRQRNFDSKWARTRPWLIDSKDGMKCLGNY